MQVLPAGSRRLHLFHIATGKPRHFQRGLGARWHITPQEDIMANTASAKKATRVIARRTDVNIARRSRMRSFIRKVEEALASGDAGAAAAALTAAEPEIMRASQKGVVHKNTASRKVARLAKRVRSLGA
jgi:small subunit ribosomal protein S20